MKKLLSIALCLIAVSGFAQKGKTKMAADFYGVDYSCVSVVGANEQPAEFIKAFEAINRLFLSEPKKYDVAGFTGIDILSTNVEQANEALGGLAAEPVSYTHLGAVRATTGSRSSGATSISIWATTSPATRS